MDISFLKYFFRFIFWGKNKQRTLLLALIGLTLSSFALFVLQSSMGGLQRNLMNRAKRVEGHGVINLKNRDKEFVESVAKRLRALGHLAYEEFEVELLLKNSSYLGPVVIHALNFQGELPPFLKERDLSAGVVGADLAQKMRITYSSEVTLISPSHTNVMMTEIPRFVTTGVSDLLRSEVPEVDMYHFWVDSRLLFNLIRDYQYNTIRFFSPFVKEDLQKILVDEFGDFFALKSWEEQNEALVWALNLETRVMVSLFIAMTLLVGLAITSGLLIFFNRIQVDLVSFWMLGMSKMKIEKMSFGLVNLLGLFASSLGILMGLFFLYFLDQYSGVIMPDVFIERKIPVEITLRGVLIALFVPYLISQLFSWISLRQFKRDQRSFITQLRD